MNVILYIIILISEILYYSMFMKFAKKEGKLWKYMLTFIINTGLIFIFNSMNVLSYLVFVMFTLFALKYIVKTKTSLFDMLVIFVMMIIKVLIETPTYMIFGNLFNIYIIGIIYSLIKIILMFLLRNELNILYKKSKKKWDNNNFYIRYIFTILMFAYSIISCVFIILYYM